jgi:hypothetical protein
MVMLFTISCVNVPSMPFVFVDNICCDVKQFYNGVQPKVPTYLGGISVVVCFMAAAVSLALALAIVPPQVTPWTGLLLMYEWTFTLFILLFGGYLYLTYQWGKTTATQAGSGSLNPESFDYDSGKGLSAWSTYEYLICIIIYDFCQIVP